MPVYKKQFTPADGQAALTTYVLEAQNAFNMAETPWATKIGMLKTVGPGIVTTRFPMEVFTSAFEEFKGEPKFESFNKKYITVDQKAWQAGARASLDEVLQGGSFSVSPSVLAGLAAEAPNAWTSTLLESSELADWDDLSFFNDAHLLNPFDTSIGTFDNLKASTALTLANFKAMREYFPTIKRPDGKASLGLQMTHVMIPPQLLTEIEEILYSTLSYDGSQVVDNYVRRNRVEVVINDRLTSATTWYPMALNHPVLKPWAVVLGNNGAPMMHALDENSDHFKLYHELRVNAFVDGNVGVLAPHCIAKCTA